MNILYAASNDFHGKIQADRCLPYLIELGCNLKIAAYQKYLPNLGADWSLDPLLYPKEEGGVLLLQNNKYLDLYEDQVKSFNPDLVISDLEIYTSFVALRLNKQLWHVSNKIHNFGISYLFKMNINIHKYFKKLYENSFIKNEIINNANKNYVYSHFCDMENIPSLINNFDWIRPYHLLNKESESCRHNYVGVDSDYSIINFLKNKKDSVAFSLNDLSYQNLICKIFNSNEEYSCNVKNCNYYVCDGSASFIADAFYNQKKFIIIPNRHKFDCTFNYLLYNKVYDYLIEDDIVSPVKPIFNPNVSFLHEKILEIKK